MKVNELALKVKYRKEQFGNLDVIDAFKVISAILMFVIWAVLGFWMSLIILVIMLFGIVFSQIKKTFKLLILILLLMPLCFIPFSDMKWEMEVLLYSLIIYPLLIALFLSIPYFLLNSAAKNLRKQTKKALI